MAFVMGGICDGASASMERYDASSGQWSAAAAMGTARYMHGACAIAGELYVTGGRGNDEDDNRLASVEKYSPSINSWSTVAPLPEARSKHAAVAVGSAMYVLGGWVGANSGLTASALKFDSAQGRAHAGTET
jgi:N-acetylneuraminic acid mutarotase